MQPETLFASAAHGGAVAYQVLGEGPTSLVFTAGSFNHVDVFWEDPAMAHFLRRLSTSVRLVAFDRRGAGASDPLPEGRPPSPEDWEADLRAVVTAAGLERFSIMACFDAGPAALRLAGKHSGEVDKLVLFNSTARMVEDSDYPEGLSSATAAAVLDSLSSTWGTERGAALYYPARCDDEQFLRWYAKYQRSVMPRAALRSVLAAAFAADVRPELPAVSAPTLVLHREQYVAPVAQAEYLTRHLQDAQLVVLPGGGALMGATDSVDIAAEVLRFLDEGRGDRVERRLAVLLFTDIVDSTGTATRLGDWAWRDLVQRHDELTVSFAERFGGRVVQLTGDGALATFSTPSQAVACAAELQRALRSLGLGLRCGVHAGEVELRGPDGYGGVAVHIAARVMSAAGPGELWTSSTVQELLEGSGVLLEDQGLRDLKGVSGQRRLYKVTS